MKKTMLLVLLLFSIQFYAQKNEQHTIFKGNNLWLKDIIAKSDNNLSKSLKPIDFKNTISNYRNKLGRSNTLFIVYTKSKKTNTEVLSCIKNLDTVSINTNMIKYYGTEKKLNNNRKGNIVVIQFTNRHIKNGSIEFNKEFVSSKESGVLEFVFFPNRIGTRQKQKIETYLALKYGISLEKTQNYYDASYKLIWDAEENETFSNHVFGLGKDTQSGLLKKAAVNFHDDFLSVYFNETTDIKDGTFLLIGDNDDSLELVLDENAKYKTMSRAWKIAQTDFSDESSFNFTIQQEENQDTAFSQYWMLISEDATFDIETSRRVLASSIEGNQVVFNNISFKDGEEYFTFIKSKRNTTIADLVTIYPNPVAKGKPMELHLNLQNEEKVSIVIHTLRGQLLFSDTKKVLGKYTFSYQLPKAGVYMVTVSVGDETNTTKVISK